jgi:hypothetical protein
MRYLLVLAVFLTGCATTVPVKAKWPEVPADLTKACSKLGEVKADTKKLSEVVGVVVDNYTLYHECNIKVDGWTDWYNEQKKVYEEVK